MNHEASRSGLVPDDKRTRTGEFLAPMEREVHWAALVDLVLSPKARRAAGPFRRRRCCASTSCSSDFKLSDPEMEGSLHDMPPVRKFAELGHDSRLPDESTILRSRPLLELHRPADQILPSTIF